MKIGNYIPYLVTAGEVTNHKPNPDIFLAVAKKMNVAPENCVVIEDADSGIEAAKRAGMRAIGYLHKHNHPTELRKADMLTRRFSDISYELLEHLVR